LKPICDDCARGHDIPKDAPGCYAVCSVCGIKRACFGDDPEPIPPRRKVAAPINKRAF
jgi:hypothetical protein